MALGRFQRTIQDAAGNVLAGATVTVRKEVPGAPLAQLYSDRDGLVAIGNPITADADGMAAFHAIGGAYRIDAVLGGSSATWRYVPVGTAGEGDLADVLAAAVSAAEAAVAADLADVVDDAEAAAIASAANGGTTTGGSANAQTLTSGYGLSGYVDGRFIGFEAGFTNTAAATLNIDGLGAKNLKRLDGTALQAGDIVAGGMFLVAYETGADVLLLLNPAPAKLPTVNGVVFPATQVASADPNTLDDYEEGTFTPTFSATGCTFNYAVQAGRYTKIGRMVFFTIAVKLAATGNTLAANQLSIAGLPFANGAANTMFPLAWFAATSSYVQLFAELAPSATSVAVFGITAAATSIFSAANASAALHATNGSEIRLSGAYSV